MKKWPWVSRRLYEAVREGRDYWYGETRRLQTELDQERRKIIVPQVLPQSMQALWAQMAEYKRQWETACEDVGFWMAKYQEAQRPRTGLEQRILDDAERIQALQSFMPWQLMFHTFGEEVSEFAMRWWKATLNEAGVVTAADMARGME